MNESFLLSAHSPAILVSVEPSSISEVALQSHGTAELNPFFAPCRLVFFGQMSEMAHGGKRDYPSWRFSGKPLAILRNTESGLQVF